MKKLGIGLGIGALVFGFTANSAIGADIDDEREDIIESGHQLYDCIDELGYITIDLSELRDADGTTGSIWLEESIRFEGYGDDLKSYEVQQRTLDVHLEPFADLTEFIPEDNQCSWTASIRVTSVNSTPVE